MSESPHFPNDTNGAVLRRMFDDGDDLSKPRTLDFCFIFPERQLALAFAELVNEREFEVCISYYEAREMWEAKVRRHMIPTHQGITALESELAARAASLRGKADGWGCMTVKRKDAD